MIAAIKARLRAAAVLAALTAGSTGPALAAPPAYVPAFAKTAPAFDVVDARPHHRSFDISKALYLDRLRNFFRERHLRARAPKSYPVVAWPNFLRYRYWQRFFN
jgi:hypothetical protein